jgi:flagellar hook-associated protein 2
MATISSAGIGSGLDVQSIVSKLIALEKQPLNQLQSRGSTLATKISSWGTVKSQLSSLQDAAKALTTSTNWSTRSFTSSDTTAITGSVTSSAAAGAYSVNVTALAQQQVTRMATGITAGSGIGQDGTLEITLGSWSGNTFSGSGGAVTLSVSSTDTLSTIAQNINNLGAGVTATVVSSGGQDNLILRSDETGASQGFQIRALDGTNTPITDGTGLGALAYASNGTSIYGMTQTQAAQNAAATIEGIAVTSSTNTISDAISGLTLELKGETSSPVTVTVGKDLDAIKTKIQGFVDAYNTLVSTLSQYTKYDQGSKTAGPLQGDSTAVGMLNTLKRMVGATGPAGTSFSRMSDVGLELQQSGQLTVNSTKLATAMESLADLETFFSATSADTTSSGLATRFYDYAFGAMATQGALSGRTNALQKAVDRNNDAIDRMNDRISQTEARLYKTYNALDTKMASLSALSSYVSQQIATWNKSS